MALIHSATVLHSGWESDNELWVIEKAGIRHLLTTSHGEDCTMKKEELLDKIEETRRSLDALKKAAQLMGYDNT